MKVNCVSGDKKVSTQLDDDKDDDDEGPRLDWAGVFSRPQCLVVGDRGDPEARDCRDWRKLIGEGGLEAQEAGGLGQFGGRGPLLLDD